IARNVLYAPIRLLNNGRTKTCGTPFFVHKSGKTQGFMENTSRIATVTFDISSLSNSLYGKKCRVVYWDNKLQGWIPTGVAQILKYQPKEEAKKTPSATITFKDVASNAVYRVVNSEITPKGSAYGRPFIYDNELSKFIDY
ncbi:MAG: hypothetical protein JWR38_701, partial [Mucilaginibacter sp.]|nr:hypothetical protein [Mucilaginibacter sp.]